MNVSVSRAIGDTYSIALKNIPSIFAAAILWVITIWVPYINVGTTIALFNGLPLELSRGEVINPLSIFNGKYRKFMGEYFICVSLMVMGTTIALFFLIIPAIVISIGWMFAVLLLVDREMNPTEALAASTKYTYGYKWTIFFSQLLVSIILIVIYLVCFGIINAADSGFVTFIIGVPMFGLLASINVSFAGAMYRMLVVERDAQPEEC